MLRPRRWSRHLSKTQLRRQSNWLTKYLSDGNNGGRLSGLPLFWRKVSFLRLALHQDAVGRIESCESLRNGVGSQRLVLPRLKEFFKVFKISSMSSFQGVFISGL